MGQRLVYRCSPSIAWVRDANQTLVVDRETEQSWILHGVEAIVWDLLTVGYSYQSMVSMLSLTLSTSAEEAERTLAGVLEEWQGDGIVQVYERGDDGELNGQRGM